MSIRISELKPEYRKIVENDLKKYDSNSNGFIDDNEIGIILVGTKEKNASIKTVEDIIDRPVASPLTAERSKTQHTQTIHNIQLQNSSNSKSKSDNQTLIWLGCLGLVTGVSIGAIKLEKFLKANYSNNVAKKVMLGLGAVAWTAFLGYKLIKHCTKTHDKQ